MSRYLNTSVELEDDKNDFLQRTLNSSFASLHSRFPAVHPNTRFHSHAQSLPALSSQAETRLRSEQVALKLRENKLAGPYPHTRDLSFLEPETDKSLALAPLLVQDEDQSEQSESLSDLINSSAKVILVKSEIFDEDKLKQFCRAMLKRKETASFSFLPGKGLGGPVNRRDAEMLRRWVDKMESQVLGKTNAREFFEGLQVVYGQCLRELTRQVAVHCFERGALLDRVLSAYMFLFEKVIQSYKKDMHKLDFDCKEKTAKLHELYLWQLDEFKRRLHEQTSLAEGLKEDVDSFKQAETAFQVKERSYQDRFKKLQVEKEDTTKRLSRYEKRYGLLEDIDASNSRTKPVREAPSRYQFTPIRLHTIDSDDESTPFALALVLFQYVILKVVRFTGVEGEFFTYGFTKTQTQLEDFPVPSVQVETTVTSKEEQVKRVTSAMEVHMDGAGSDMEQLMHALREAEVMMKELPVDQLPENVKNSFTAVNRLMEKSVVHSKSAYKLMSLLTTMVKRFQAEDDERNDAVLHAQSKFRRLERENDHLRLELEQARKTIAEWELDSASNLIDHSVSLPPESKPVTAGTPKPVHRKILYRKASTLPSSLLLDRFISAIAKPKCVMTIKTLLKTLAGLNGDYLSQMKTNPAVKTQDLAQFCYDWLMAKHTLKGATEQKFLQLLAACEFFKENAKVYLFARFFQLFEPLTGEDYRYFVSVVTSMNHWGVSFDIAELEDAFIASNECYQVLVETLVPKFPEMDPRKLKFELETQADRLSQFRTFDFINFAIKRFRIAMSATQQYVQDLFKAADLNGDGFLEEWEYYVLCRHIVREDKKMKSAKQVFAMSADLMVKYSESAPPKPVISLDKFAALSVEYELFGIEAQRAFLGVTSEEEISPLFSSMIASLPSKLTALKSRIYSDDPRFVQLRSYIESLGQRLSESKDDISVYIAYRLLEAETSRAVLK